MKLLGVIFTLKNHKKLKKKLILLENGLKI